MPQEKKRIEWNIFTEMLLSNYNSPEGIEERGIGGEMTLESMIHPDYDIVNNDMEWLEGSFNVAIYAAERESKDFSDKEYDIKINLNVNGFRAEKVLQNDVDFHEEIPMLDYATWLYNKLEEALELSTPYTSEAYMMRGLPYNVKVGDYKTSLHISISTQGRSVFYTGLDYMVLGAKTLLEGFDGIRKQLADSKKCFNSEGELVDVVNILENAEIILSDNEDND